MPASRVITAASSADLLQAVPALAGTVPRESLVLVAFRGRRTAGAARFDLPDLADDDEAALERWADRVLGVLLRVEGVDGVVPVVYTDDAFADALVAPRFGLADAVARRCLVAGLVLKDALIVGADAWGVVDGSAHVEPQRLSDLLPDDPAASVRVPRPEDLARLPEVDERQQDAFADRVSSWLGGTRAPDAVHGRPVDAGSGRRRGGLVDRALEGQDVVPYIEAALAEHPDEGGEPCECRALLAALLTAPVLRDLVMLQAAWGPRFGRHVELRTIPTSRVEPLDEAVLLAFTGGDFARPDAARVERAAALLVGVAGRLPEPARAPALTTAAWLHWTLGRSSVAAALVDAARGCEPAYGLAEILAVRLAHGHLPEWAFRSTPHTRVGRRWQALAEGGRR